MKNKRAKRWLRKGLHILNSKLVVLIAMVAITVAAVGSSVNMNTVLGDGSEPPNFGTVFQQYLLTNKDAVKNENIAVLPGGLGSIGAGAVEGSFSYDGIVNAANDDTRDQAKQFSYMMATYSYYHLISTQSQTFLMLILIAGRLLFGTVLLILGVIMDVLGALASIILRVLTMVQVIPWLANAMVNSGLGQSAFGKILGLSDADAKAFTTMALSFAIIMIVIALARAFRFDSSRIDQSQMKKFEGRLLNLIVLPLMLMAAGTLLSTISDRVNSGFTANNAPVYSQYLIDDEKWIKDRNLAPDGIGESVKFSPAKGTYIDTKFNPYKADRAKTVAENIAKDADGTNGLFGNTSLAYRYMTSTTISPREYIDYKANYNSGDKDGKLVYGGYKDIAAQIPVDASNGDVKDYLKSQYYSSQPKVKLKAAADDPNVSNASDDYSSGKENHLLGSKTALWRDMFIWGAKDSGALDKYYTDKAPSLQQISGAVGTNDGGMMSDQSMFLILSSSFDDAGGHYFISAPARGAGQIKAMFDSSRTSYYTISMVGTPLFTVPQLLATPLITFVVLSAVMITMFNIGILEMNLAPIKAWLKGLFIGDLAYGLEFIVYAIGVGGTWIALTVLPTLITTGFSSLMTIMSDAVKAAVVGKADQNLAPAADLVSTGITTWITFVVSLVLVIMFVKSPSFRDKLVAFFKMPWDWAKATAQQIESRANPVGSMMRRNQKDAAVARSNKMKGLADTALGMAGLAGDLKNRGVAGTIRNRMAGGFTDRFKDALAKGTPDRGKDGTEANDQDIINDNLTQTQRMQNDGIDGSSASDLDYLRNKNLQNPDGADDLTDQYNQSAQDAMTKLHGRPSESNKQAALQNLQTLRERMVQNGASPDDIARVDRMIDDTRGYNTIGDDKFDQPTPPVTNPDGSVVKTNADGSQDVTYPDGTTYHKAAPSGAPLTGNHFDARGNDMQPISVTNPDGSTTTMNPDGSSVTKAKDGSVLSQKPASEDGLNRYMDARQKTNADGAPIAIPNADGSTSVLKPDGSETIYRPGSGKEELPPSAAGLQRYMTARGNARQQPEYKMGNVTTTDSSGNRVVTSPTGDQTIIHRNGQMEKVTAPPASGHEVYMRAFNSQPPVTTIDAQGSKVVTAPTGAQTIKKLDGSVINVPASADGAQRFLQAREVAKQLKPVKVVDKQGIVTVTSPSGAQNITLPDGSKTRVKAPTSGGFEKYMQARQTAGVPAPTATPTPAPTAPAPRTAPQAVNTPPIARTASAAPAATTPRPQQPAAPQPVAPQSTATRPQAPIPPSSPQTKSVTNNYIHNDGAQHVVNNRNVAHNVVNKQVGMDMSTMRELRSSMGKASSSTTLQRALSQLQNSQSEAETRENLKRLRTAINALPTDQRNSIDAEKLNRITSGLFKRFRN